MCFAAETHQQRGRRGRRLDQQPGRAEVAGQWHGEQHRPEKKQHDVVDAVTMALKDKRAVRAMQIGRRHQHAGQPDDGGNGEQQRTRGVDHDPVTDQRMASVFDRNTNQHHSER